MPDPEKSARVMTFSYVSACIMTPDVCGSYVKALRRCRKSIMFSHIMELREDSGGLN